MRLRGACAPVRGKYLIPSLADMHVHDAGPADGRAGDSFGGRAVREPARWLVAVRPHFNEPLRFRVPFASACEAEEVLQLLDTRDFAIDFLKVPDIPSGAALRGLLASAKKRKLDVDNHSGDAFFVRGADPDIQ